MNSVRNKITWHVFDLVYSHVDRQIHGQPYDLVFDRVYLQVRDMSVGNAVR